MLRIIFSILVVLHGLVHLLYSGHSLRLFLMQDDMTWPDGALAFSSYMDTQAVRNFAAVLLTAAAAGFTAAGAGLLIQQKWWYPVIIASASLSSIIYILFWDGQFRSMDDKGIIGLGINAAILITVLVFKWPRL
jgi:hypothetical protein